MKRKNRFVGFVIANDIEEYLSYSLSDRYHSENIWCSAKSGRMFIEMVKVFPTFEECQTFIENVETSHKIWILSLYETSKRFLVSAEGDDVPPWIETVK
jgi:hypothetical protein